MLVKFEREFFMRIPTGMSTTRHFETDGGFAFEERRDLFLYILKKVIE